MVSPTSESNLAIFGESKGGHLSYHSAGAHLWFYAEKISYIHTGLKMCKGTYCTLFVSAKEWKSNSKANQQQMDKW